MNVIRLPFFGLLLLAFILPSCKNESSQKVITNKIMYDVPIVNEIIGDRSKNNSDWFWENLPSPEGDDYIKDLLDNAKIGKLKTAYYDMFGDYESFDEIPKDKIEDFMTEALTFNYNAYDSLSNNFIEKNILLDYKNIKNLRFLEEWYQENGIFKKKVIAIAPVFTIEHQYMEKPINSISFWILMNNI